MESMASGKTEHFGLSQWAPEDYVLREDFNADNALIDAALAASAKIQSGYYAGTGANGSSNMNTLTFDIVPQLVIIYMKDASATGSVDQGAIFMINGFNGIRPTTYNGSAYVNGWMGINVEWNGNQVSWWSGLSDKAQNNVSGKEYAYIVIGN